MRPTAILAKALLTGLLAASVAAGGEPPSAGAGNHFQTRVLPLLRTRCWQCHGAEEQEANLRLDSREAMLQGGDSGPAFVPGKPAESLLFQAVDEERPGLTRMPPKDPLSQEQIQHLVRWIEEGAPWPEPALTSLDPHRAGDPDRAHLSSDQRLGDAWSDPKNPVATAFGGERLDLWSLRPVERSAPPAVNDENWIRTPIDRFILARLETAGLRPSPQADRRTLIRRLTYDLTGLPPTPQEVEDFVSDSAPDAYDRLVERLLASSHYGERWAQHWLDVVRYSDTNGFERDEFRPTFYRYRDYVVGSLNQDKPYDQFLREQLAGDELVLGRPRDAQAVQALIATGYLRAGPRDTTAEIFEENDRARDQLMADLANTTGEALLGLTMSCCQCHDHKYDPLLQADHFRLRAFFAAIKFEDQMVVSTDAERVEIDRHNTELEAEAAPLREQQDAILAEGRRQVQSQRRAEFPEDIPALLDRDESMLDEDSKKKLEPFRAQLEVSDDDALKALSEHHRAQYEAAVSYVKGIEEQKRNYDTCWAASDSGDEPPATRIFYQGDISQPRDAVPPGFFSILDPNPAPILAPESNQTTGRRTALADWIVSPENPLTARVMVNRIWQQFFGRGIVATPNDFGFAGERPTHPELLDWLAAEFVESGWSVKHMHRLIVTSAAYRQASSIGGSPPSADLENRLLWRQNPRRLDAESLRDGLLFASGRLLAVGSGPPAWPEIPEQVRKSNPATLDASDDRLQDWYTTKDQEQTLVRSLFTIQKRSIQLPMLMAFDEPAGERTCGRREQTTVAPQAAMLMNSPFAVRCAQAMAKRVQEESGEDPARQIAFAFQIALLRPPHHEELEAAHDLYLRHVETYRRAGSDSPDMEALTDVCRALLNANEFIYLD